MNNAAEKKELELLPASEPEQNQLAIAKDQTPMTMLQSALERGLDAETLGKFMKLHEDYERGIARKAYMEAIAAFKENPPIVIKDKLNKQYGSNYATLGNLVNTVNEALGAHGLHAHWEYEQSEDSVTVTCVLAHSLGHSDQVTLSAPPDTSGSKNSIQQIRSTTTYLRGITFEAVTGIAATDKGADDDGNGATRTQEPDMTDWLAKIEESATLEDLKKIYTDAYQAAGNAKTALRNVVLAKNKRGKELSQ